MTFAAFTKGTTALLGAVLAAADHEGVRDALMREWSISLPQLADSVAPRIRQNTAKAWRFVGEMREIAATFRSANLPGEFHQAAEEIYRRQALFKGADPLPSLTAVLSAILQSGRS
jgi:hypothetical protein